MIKRTTLAMALGYYSRSGLGPEAKMADHFPEDWSSDVDAQVAFRHGWDDASADDIASKGFSGEGKLDVLIESVTLMSASIRGMRADLDALYRDFHSDNDDVPRDPNNYPSKGNSGMRYDPLGGGGFGGGGGGGGGDGSGRCSGSTPGLLGGAGGGAGGGGGTRGCIVQHHHEDGTVTVKLDSTGTTWNVPNEGRKMIHEFDKFPKPIPVPGSIEWHKQRLAEGLPNQISEAARDITRQHLDNLKKDYTTVYTTTVDYGAASVDFAKSMEDLDFFSKCTPEKHWDRLTEANRLLAEKLDKQIADALTATAKSEIDKPYRTQRLGLDINTKVDTWSNRPSEVDFLKEQARKKALKDWTDDK